MSDQDKIKNTFLWGFVLWLLGYVAGIVLFFIVPKEYIGWLIAPFAVLITVFVLIKKVKRPELMCYFGLGLVWTIMAIVLDYIFIVKLFNSNDYYKPDVYLYYFLTFSLPLAVGYWKFKHKKLKEKLF